MKKVILFSGPINSGKTTRLQKFISGKNCDGVIAPVINGKRYIQRIKTGEIRLLDSDCEDSTRIGKHNFSKETFEWAREQIKESFNRKVDYVVIDEIGPLEMRGKGYEPMLSKIFMKNDINLVIVVRDSLVADMIEYYHFDRENIEIKKTDQD